MRVRRSRAIKGGPARPRPPVLAQSTVDSDIVTINTNLPNMPETPVLVVTVAGSDSSPPQGRSSGGELLRGASLFRAISKRLAQHKSSSNSANRHPEEEDDSSSSSSSSTSSTSGGEQGRVEAALKKIARSLAPERKSSSQQAQPVRRILRQPVAYTYVRGMSGLPTIRVPRSSTCCPNNNSGYVASYPCEL